MNYFVVFQNKTFKEEHGKGILWAPKKDKNNQSTRFYWESMKLAKKGDIVFSIIKNYIVARSIVTNEAIDSQNPFDNDLWSRDGWLVKLDYDFTIDRIKVMEYIQNLKHLLPDKHSPFNKVSGRGNQGYLFPISKELGMMLDVHITDTYKIDDLNEVFKVDHDEADIIKKLFEEQGLDEADVIILETDPPNKSNKPKTKRKVIHARKTDFIEKAKKDAKTGILAEELVVNYEKDYLTKNHRTDLAERVKWVAKEADGFGYDVLSYDLDSNEKYIEVKATTLSISNPFDISANEIETSKEKKSSYWIYRIFYADSDRPNFYKIQGSIEDNFELEATSFKAYNKEKL